MNAQTLKGFRDFLPVDARKRQFVISTLKQVFAAYGFDPLETPALEYEGVLLGKYGDEGDKLMYRFEDNGGRRVALRYDQTVPLARVVSNYANELPLPFKRFQIQNVWRAENTQKGRFREFLQCDIDIVGTASLGADAEIITVVNQALQKLGFTDYSILVNDRRVFGDLPAKAITILDKLKKIGEEKVIMELKENGFNPEILLQIKSAKPTEDLEKVIDIAEDMGTSKGKIKFEPTLARGLDYYTGTIVEVEIDNYSAGSVGGGGRFDNLLGLFNKTSLPAVGFAFGFDRLLDAMEQKNLFPNDLSGAKVLVTIFNNELAKDSLKAASLMREKNVPTEVWLDVKTDLEKQLKYADRKKIPYVVIIGPNEKSKNTVTLKNLVSKEQKEVSVSALPDEIH